MKKLLLAAAGLASLLLPCVTSHAQVFQVSVHGSRKFQNMVNGKQVISSQPVTNATLFKTNSVSSKDYIVTFDTGSDVLQLTPKAGGTPISVLGLDSSYTSYNADSPKGFQEFGSLANEGDAAGTEFDSLVGVITIKVSETPGGTFKGVSCTVNGASENNSPYYLYTIAFSGTKIVH